MDGDVTSISYFEFSSTENTAPLFLLEHDISEGNYPSDFASFVEYVAQFGIYYEGDAFHFVTEGVVEEAFASSFNFGTDSNDLEIVNGTSSSETIKKDVFLDSDGDSINDSGQYIFGGSANDYIYDGAGDDFVYGEDGHDQFFGNLGADVYDGGAGVDTVRYIYATDGFTVDMVNTENSTGFATGDSFTSVERIETTHGDDVIVLGAGVNLNNARNGDDHITDGGGFEDMRGGNGADTFVFVAGDGARDQILDFEIVADVIDLTNWNLNGIGDLAIYEDAATSHVWIDAGAEGLEITNLTQSDIGGLTAESFIFV